MTWNHLTVMGVIIYQIIGGTGDLNTEKSPVFVPFTAGTDVIKPE